MKTDDTTVAADDEFATADELAKRWHTTKGALAQLRYLGTGPEYFKRGRRGQVLYPWSGIRAYEQRKTLTSSGERPGAA